jgi:hypothetical protein
MHRHLAQCGRGAHTGLHAHYAGFFLIEAHVGAGGLAAQANAPLPGTRLPQRDVGIQQREGQFFRAVLEVDARVRGFKRRQPWASRAAIGRCVCRRASPDRNAGLRRRSAEDGIEVPLPRSGAHQVETGFVHADLVDFELAAPQRQQAQRSRHLGGMQHRFDAVGGIFGNAQVGEHKAGPRQKAHFNRGKPHRPPQRLRDEVRDLALVMADADQRRHHQRQHQHRQDGQSYPQPVVQFFFAVSAVCHCVPRIILAAEEQLSHVSFLIHRVRTAFPPATGRLWAVDSDPLLANWVAHRSREYRSPALLPHGKGDRLPSCLTS